MPNPLSTSDAPDLVDKSVRKVYIKDGHRIMLTDGGWMKISSDKMRRMFGKYRGGRYSKLQEK